MQTPPNKLALEIATALDDLDALSLHQEFTKKYSETFLRKKLLRVLSIPERKIKRSRAALYTYLIQQHEHHRGRTGRSAKEKEEQEEDYRYEAEEDDRWT